MIRFEMAVPMSKMEIRSAVDGLSGTYWRPCVYALYLRLGQSVPDAAKTTKGVTYGPCSADGEFLPLAYSGATHFGWTLDPAGEE